MKQDGKTRKQLEKEKNDYQRMAETDWLTGLYNRGAMEKYVNQELKTEAKGTMLVMDLDRFKQVNDRYGHIAGDRLLQYVADVLKRLFPRCLVGRVGGDEFVVFDKNTWNQETVTKAISRIEERFSDVRLEDSLVIRLDITITAASCRPLDLYQQLFDRADQLLLVEKQRRRELLKAPGRNRDGISVDVRLIGSQLRESRPDGGAFCQDFDSFKQIYRFVERKLTRTKDKVFLILFTLADNKNNFPDLNNRDGQVSILGEAIQKNLRLGDLFTKYSSCQFLVMVSDLNKEHVEVVVNRISDCFYSSRDPESSDVILHLSYPLHSVLLKEEYRVLETDT